MIPGSTCMCWWLSAWVGTRPVLRNAIQLGPTFPSHLRQIDPARRNRFTKTLWSGHRRPVGRIDQAGGSVAGRKARAGRPSGKVGCPVPGQVRRAGPPASSAKHRCNHHRGRSGSALSTPSVPHFPVDQHMTPEIIRIDDQMFVVNPVGLLSSIQWCDPMKVSMLFLQ